MRKYFIIIIFLIISGLIYWQRVQLIARFKPALKLQNLSQTLQNNAVVGDLKKQIFNTSGPLRAQEESETSYLTRTGVIKWTNQNRQTNKKAALTENLLLDKAAQIKLRDMFDKQYFEHVSPSGIGAGDLAKTVGYDFVDIGENLALGNFKDDQALVQAWMNSPGHRANILNGKFEEIGVAVGQGIFEGKQTWLAVQEFGKPASSCPAVDLKLKSSIDTEQVEVARLGAALLDQKAAIDSLNQQTPDQVQAFNQQIAVYNNAVAVYNNRVDILKQMVSLYNGQVKAYNACAE